MKREAHPESPEFKTPSRWPGPILSFFVPGFGLIRAGNIRRGIAWLIGIELLGVAIGLVFSVESIPIVFGWVAIAIGLLIQIWMLCDSFRPGRMTPGGWGVYLVFLVVIVFLPHPSMLVMRAFKVPSISMEPTLMGFPETGSADQVVMSRLSYLFSKPQRGDLVVFTATARQGVRAQSDKGEVYWVKRIVGLPGERIEIREGSIYANGKKLGSDEGVPPVEYVSIRYSNGSAKREGGAYLVGENEYFMMGDNSPHSADSRLWGGLPRSNIKGKVTKIFYPFSRMGKPAYPMPERME